MLNQFRNSSKSTSFRPTVEALENRLVPSGSGLKPNPEVMPLPPLVGLTLEHGLGREAAVVVHDQGTQVEALVRLHRVVGDAVATPVTNTSLPSYHLIKIEFLKTIDGGTSPVESLSLNLPMESLSLNLPMESLSLNFLKTIDGGTSSVTSMPSIFLKYEY